MLSPVEQSIKRKIEAVGTPLRDWDIHINYGIKTGFNDAFIIDGRKKDELIAQDPKSAEIIRPILRGRDIQRYGYTFKDKWLIATHNGIKEKGIPPVDVAKYPAIKAHLDKFYPQIAQRQDKGYTPYNLRNCVYMDDFSKQKIMWSEISDIPKFAIDKAGKYCITNKVFLMTGNENLTYLYYFLNSIISEKYFSFISSTTGEGTNQWFKYKVKQMPIPKKSFYNDSLLGLLNDNDINKIQIRFIEFYNFTIEEINYLKIYLHDMN